MSAPLIEVRGLSKRFSVQAGLIARRRIGEVVAVDDVSFDIHDGETLGCVGESGSGKSTLGRLILGLVAPDAGEVKFAGREITGLPGGELRALRRDLQIVFQDPLQSLNPRRTVGENVARPLANFGVDKGTARRRVAEVLEMVGLSARHADRYPHEFSGGQCQRVVIGRALALGPRFLFLDEPVSALDVSIQAQIINLLEDLQSELNLTYLFVSHDLELVRHFSDRTMVLYHGRLVELGPSDEVYRRPLHPYTRTLQAAVLHADRDGAWEGVADRSAAALAAQESRSAEGDPATGCIYEPMCSERFAPCTHTHPPLIEPVAGRLCACHLHMPCTEITGRAVCDGGLAEEEVT